MNLFYCPDCRKSFEGIQLLKKEYIDPIFGNCWKYVAICPRCKTECSEEKEKKPLIRSKSLNTNAGYPGCGGGPCCGCPEN
jgi:hypothetical protein